MNAAQLLSEGLERIAENPALATETNVLNLRIAARLKWEQEEMGGIEHVQFAYRNNTPIVPMGHCGHPIELVKRGYIDGLGWPKDRKPKVNLFKWPDGNHWYASVDGETVTENGSDKWNSAQEAEDAAKRWIDLTKSQDPLS